MKTGLICLLFSLMLGCENKPAKQISTNKRQDALSYDSGRVSLRRVGVIEFRRSFAGMQFSQGKKEQEAYLQREEKANPTLGSVQPDSTLFYQLQKFGFIKNNELLLKKFHQTASSTKLIDSRGQALTIRFAFLKGRLDAYQITAFKGNDSASQQTYSYTEALRYTFLDLAPGGNKELLLLNTYYVMNGYNFDVEIYEISAKP